MSELGSAGAKALWYSLIIALVWDPYQVCSRWCRHWAARLSSMSCQLNLFLTYVRECGFRKFLLLEPGIQKFVLLKSGILGFGIRNTAQRIRNPSNDWNPESKFQWQEPGTWWLESGIYGVGYRIQDCLRFSYMEGLLCLPQFWVKIDRTLRSGRRSRHSFRFLAEATSW